MVTRTKCDASCAGLGAALEQRTYGVRKTIAFASRFLNSSKELEPCDIHEYMYISFVALIH